MRSAEEVIINFLQGVKFSLINITHQGPTKQILVPIPMRNSLGSLVWFFQGYSRYSFDPTNGLFHVHPLGTIQIHYPEGLNIS